MTAKESFTVEEMLQAAEKSQYTNFNSGYLQYSGHYDPDGYQGTYGQKVTEKDKPIKACVIGEAFLQLGFVPNGLTPHNLSDTLSQIKPDGGEVIVNERAFDNLEDFINTLNSVKGYSGKKRMAHLVRKHFSNSLNTVIRVKTRDINPGFVIQMDGR